MSKDRDSVREYARQETVIPAREWPKVILYGFHPTDGFWMRAEESPIAWIIVRHEHNAFLKGYEAIVRPIMASGGLGEDEQYAFVHSGGRVEELTARDYETIEMFRSDMQARHKWCRDYLQASQEEGMA